MSQPSCRKRGRPNDWGSNFQDFNVGMGKVQQASTRPRQSRKKWRHNQKPTLAPQTDEWHRVVSAIALEEDIDNMGDLASDSEGNDSHAGKVNDGYYKDDSNQQSDFRTINCSVIYNLLNHIEEEFNRKTLDLSSLPEPQRANIERYNI